MKLRLHQLKAVNNIITKKKHALHLDMSIGKTIITLTAIKSLIDSFAINKILVIAPRHVANTVWHNEILKWEHLKGLTYSVCTGNEKQRLKTLNENVDIYIINRENIVWLFEQGYANKFDFIVVDESASFKNPSAKRFKALKKFKCEYLVELSGTPNPNGLLDIWSQIYLLDQGESLEKYITHYKDKYFNVDRSGYKFTAKNPEIIYKKIEHLVTSMRAEDYLELPEKNYVFTYVDLPNMKDYRYFKKNMVINIKDTTIIAETEAVLGNKLLQFCNGAIYDEFGNTHEIHNAKLDVLEDILEDNPNDNFIVAYNYKSDLERIKKRFKQAVVMDKKSSQVELWNKGQIKLLLCHPESCGEGLNLQFGGNMIIWFGLTWNLKSYLQLNARLHRQGQTKPVIINHIVAKSCEDERVIKGLNLKNIQQEELLNRFKV